MQKQERVFEITRGKVWLALLMAAIALTVVFELGVSIGRKREIRLQMEVLRLGDTKMSAAERTPTQAKAPYKPLPKRSTEQPETEEEMQYTVQVSTFRSPENADEMVKLLESYEYKPWMRAELHGEETLYSVFVGSFDTRDEAEQFGRAISERLSFVPGYMVREKNEEDVKEIGANDRIADHEF